MTQRDSTYSVRGRHVVVVGAARSGIAAAELLLRRGARVTLTEVRDTFEGADRLERLGVTLELGGHRSATLAAADLVVTSPGVPVQGALFDEVRSRGIEVIGELELASRWLKGRVIAITGTKGKSTTTTLIGRMLTAAQRTVAVGGNIGVPLSTQVETSTSDTVHVVEASSFQLETTTTFRPWVSVWLNLTDDHLDRHASLEEYAEAKARVLANQTTEDWAVLNADDPVVMRYGASTSATRMAFSLEGRIDEGVLLSGDWVVRRSRTAVEPLVPVAAVELTGRHMLNNVLAATAVAWIAGARAEQMVTALSGFHGLEHVMEPAGVLGGVRFVNDSKATNVDAARRSIESFPRGVVAIVGGHFKGGDLGVLGEALRGRGRAVVAIGDSAALVDEVLSPIVRVERAGSMQEAVARAYAAASPDGVVLLAPACASFDWFRDYAERGRVFKEEVARLRGQTPGAEESTRER
jgi:UDP-N-acetylmuramoylalanine--D-glutamate ligase